MFANTTVFRLPTDSGSALSRAQIDLAGEDVSRFLQGLLSADVEQIKPNTAQASALLTVKGKIVTELLVLSTASGKLRLCVPASQLSATLELLDRYIIMDDVTPTAAKPQALACVWGEHADQLVRQAEGIECYATRHPVPGWLVVGDEPAVTNLASQATQASLEQFTRYRVETASPLWGAEIQPDRFPPEVGFVYAVNYDKGCYMGQEPLARIHARGQVNRVLVRVEADAAPAGSAPLKLATPERPDVGMWTTWVGDGPTLGLAIVRRKFAEPGQLLDANGQAVKVCSGPLGDDRGVANRHA